MYHLEHVFTIRIKSKLLNVPIQTAIQRRLISLSGESSSQHVQYVPKHGTIWHHHVQTCGGDLISVEIVIIVHDAAVIYGKQYTIYVGNGQGWSVFVIWLPLGKLVYSLPYTLSVVSPFIYAYALSMGGDHHGNWQVGATEVVSDMAFLLWDPRRGHQCKSDSMNTMLTSRRPIMLLLTPLNQAW